MSETTTFDPKDLTRAKLHHLLLAAIAPRPIAFASTIDSEGHVNLSPFSFFNVFSSNPPVMIFSPAKSGRDGSLKHTHENVLQIPEVVINTVDYDMVQQMSLASTSYARQVNEFTKAGFSEVASDLVKPPRVKESPAAFECEVREVVSLGGQGSGNLVICDVVRMHIQSRFINGEGRLDTRQLNMVGRMGENWYCRIDDKALFEIQKPGNVQGIGVDSLPKNVRFSKVLTGNQLGKLGSCPNLPSPEQIINAKKQLEDLQLNSLDELHKYAQSLLEKDQRELALSVLLTQSGEE